MICLWVFGEEFIRKETQARNIDSSGCLDPKFNPKNGWR